MLSGSLAEHRTTASGDVVPDVASDQITEIASPQSTSGVFEMLRWAVITFGFAAAGMICQTVLALSATDQNTEATGGEREERWVAVAERKDQNSQAVLAVQPHPYELSGSVRLGR